jgi:ABC-type uncharacterized transport system involved in gliding motility auxiliary subunit
MKRIIDFLAPAGLLVALAASVAYLAGKPLPGKLEVYLIVGGALILAHLLLRWEAVVRAIGGRQLRYGTNVLVLTLVVCGFLGGINYIASRRIVRWDLTKSQRYSLSDQTKKIVSGLNEDVHVTYFQRAGSPGLEEGRDRLRSYEALSKHLQVEYVDPVVKRGRAEALDVRGPWPVLVIEKAGNRERVSSDNEQELTNALIKVTRSGRKTVCFAEGEGERDIDDNGEQGLSEVKTALSKSLYEAKKVALLRVKAVPADCTVLAIAGPQADLMPPAIDAVRAYVKGGGKALVLLEPELKGAFPNVTALLKEWNVEAGQNVIIDTSGLGQIFGMGPLVPLAMKYPPSHEITRDFRVATAFPTARSMKAGSATLEGITAETLAETSPDSWGETDLSLKEPVRAEQGKDTYGPLSLAVAVTVRGKAPAPTPAPSPAPGAEPETPKAPEGRVVAMGDSDFASNGYVGLQGNKDFFLNSVAWLAQDVDLISIRPKEADDQRMFLTGNQKLAISLFALIGLPGLCLAAGIFVWLKRR